MIYKYFNGVPNWSVSRPNSSDWVQNIIIGKHSEYIYQLFLFLLKKIYLYVWLTFEWYYGKNSRIEVENIKEWYCWVKKLKVKNSISLGIFMLISNQSLNFTLFLNYGKIIATVPNFSLYCRRYSNFHFLPPTVPNL